MASITAHSSPAEVDRATATACVLAVDAIAFWALIAGFAFAPFWFGGDRPLAWGLQAIWFAAISLLYETGRVISRRRHPISLRRIWLPALCVIAIALWATVQMSPWTPLPYQHPVWQMMREALDKKVPGAISVDVDETATALLRFATGICLFWTTMQLCRAPRQAHLLVAAVAAIGALYAAYGIIAFSAFPRTILWYKKLDDNGYLTSTFVSRSCYATYAGLGLIAALSIALSHFAGAVGGAKLALMRRLTGLVAISAGSGGAWLAASFVIAVALILTASRSGIGSALCGVLVFFGMIVARRHKNAIGIGAGFVVLLALAGCAVTFGFGADRIASLGLASDDRLAVYRLGLLSIADAPWFGFGWGTFAEVFPIYRDASLGPFQIWDRAYNSYIELFQGLGIPAAILFITGFTVLIWRCACASLSRRQSATAPLVATSTSLIVFLQAFVGFSLQTQAVMLTWIALLAAGVAQSWSSRVATDV